MALGKNSEAAEVLSKSSAPDGWEEYLRINRGIALLRAGDVEGGRAVLDTLGKQDADNEELRALRDRANLGLGCGNPVALASLKEGETVLDLGAGPDPHIAPDKDVLPEHTGRTDPRPR